MHHVGCMASPELYVVQGARRFTTWGTWLALNPTWFRAPFHAPCKMHGKPRTRRSSGRHVICTMGGSWLALYPAWYRAPFYTSMYYVYVLKNHVDHKLYVGYTTNLRERLQKHQNGEVTSTKFRRPFELIFYEGYKSMKDAKRRERYLKSSKGKSSLNMMLRDSLK
jgi:putative endonuclease